ncbi:MAG TPA: hypothetical protein DCE56_45205 [Cyanobacteria bacterium UBA8553]|nr:hypothetical protein [Cyanobacteria bacterium UBA8553]
MNAYQGKPKALFLSPDGNIYPDILICSGILPTELNGKHCLYSQTGSFPEPLPLAEFSSTNLFLFPLLVGEG